MTRLSNSQLEVLRTRPQQTQLYLSIYQPQIIFTAKINDSSITRGARTITYNNSTGTFSNIENGMTLWIGNTFTGQEVGKIRIRSATSSTIIVSENSNIDWQNQQFLTVYKYWELWPIFPRIITDPSNATNTIWYKDYDIAYTNQNSVLGTYVDAGPHRAANLDPASGQARVYWSSTGSYNLRGSTLSYSWSFAGGTPSTSTAADPGYITYNSAGHYVTKLIISGSNGEVDTTYRYVSIYDNAHPPIQKWAMEDLRGSRDEGGYSLPIKVFETIPIQQNAVVVIYGNNYYGSTINNLGGNYPNGGDIFFVGYIDKDTIEYDYQHSEVSFEAVSITQLMKKSSGFSVSVGSKASPAYWYELLDMDGRRALYHYLRWHTTAMLFNDFQWQGDDYKIQFFDSDRESMYDALNNYMRDTLIGQVVSDRQGKVWMEIQAMAYTNPTGTFTPIMDITNRDWMGQPVLEERLNPEVAYAEYGGVAYSGTVTGTWAAMIGSAPGTTPGYYGGIDNHQGMALLGQSQLNSLIGNVVANKNSSYPKISVPMTINTGNLDIAPQEVVGLHIAKNDTVRNLKIDGLYLPDDMTWKYDPNGQILFPEINFKQLVSGIAGQTVTIPATPTNNIGAGFNVPSFHLPAFPPLSFPVSPANGILASISRILVHDNNLGANKQGLLLCENFNTSSPTYTQINTTLLVSEWTTLNQIVVCPNGSIYVGSIGGSGNPPFIAYAPYPGAAFSNVANTASLADLLGPGSPVIFFMACRPDLPEEVIFFALSGGNAGFFHGNYSSGFTMSTFLNSFSGAGLGTPTYGANKWMSQSSNSGYVVVWNSNYTSPNSIVLSLGFNNVHTRTLNSGNTLNVKESGGTYSLVQGIDNATSHIDITPSGIAFDSVGNTPSGNYRFVADESGQYIFTQNTSLIIPIRSIDGGYTFSQITGLQAVNWLFDGRGVQGGSQWIASSHPLLGAIQVYSNEDGGQGSWINKSGNLATLNSSMVIDALKILG